MDSKSYKELKKFDLALYHSEEKELLQIKINKLKQALIISLDEVKRNVSEKNIKIIEKDKLNEPETITLPKLRSGLYFIYLTSSKGVTTKKIINSLKIVSVLKKL